MALLWAWSFCVLFVSSAAKVSDFHGKNGSDVIPPGVGDAPLDVEKNGIVAVLNTSSIEAAKHPQAITKTNETETMKIGTNSSVISMRIERQKITDSPETTLTTGNKLEETPKDPKSTSSAPQYSTNASDVVFASTNISIPANKSDEQTLTNDTNSSDSDEMKQPPKAVEADGNSTSNGNTNKTQLQPEVSHLPNAKNESKYSTHNETQESTISPKDTIEPTENYSTRSSEDDQLMPNDLLLLNDSIYALLEEEYFALFRINISDSSVWEDEKKGKKASEWIKSKLASMSASTTSNESMMSTNPKRSESLREAFIKNTKRQMMFVLVCLMWLMWALMLITMLVRCVQRCSK